MIVCLKNWLDLNDIAAAVEIGRTKVKKKTPVTATSEGEIIWVGHSSQTLMRAKLPFSALLQ